MDISTNPQLWRVRAQEARSEAEDVCDEEARRIIRRIAQEYEQLAVRASERIREKYQSMHRSAAYPLGVYQA